MPHAAIPAFVEAPGALVPGSVLRTALNSLTDGLEGVIGPDDCRVLELAVPGQAIRVTTGSYVIRSKATGAARENYLGLVESEDVVPVQQNLGSTTRYDLVVFQVENPYAPGETWPIPADPAAGPYVFTRIIENVPANVALMSQLAAPYRYRTALPLARLAVPASTATVTQPMITPLAVPIRYGERLEDGYAATQLYTDGLYIPVNNGLGNTTDFVNWPSDAVWQVPVPKWATGMDIIRCSVSNARMDSDYNAFGEMRLLIDGQHSGTPTQFDIDTTAAGDNTPAGGSQRFPLEIAGTYNLPASVRGRTVPIRFQARKIPPVGGGAGNTGNLEPYKVYCTFAVNFQAKPTF